MTRIKTEVSTCLVRSPETPRVASVWVRRLYPDSRSVNPKVIEPSQRTRTVRTRKSRRTYSQSRLCPKELDDASFRIESLRPLPHTRDLSRQCHSPDSSVLSESRETFDVGRCKREEVGPMVAQGTE